MSDRDVLRDVANRVKEISTREEQSVKANLWKACNDLKPERPMVLADTQGGWSELDRQWVQLECEDEQSRAIELELKRVVVSPLDRRYSPHRIVSAARSANGLVPRTWVIDMMRLIPAAQRSKGGDVSPSGAWSSARTTNPPHDALTPFLPQF